ncbi:MAG: glucose-1-phosphate adenylyltransferase family protein [candidate division KSB1 bacterium]
MQKTLAMILAGGRVDELSVLTQFRPKSAVPFGGLYRVIDFPLSNLMHSGIENVGILSQYRSFSLINHIGNGSAWEMVGRNRGVSILPPYTAHTLSHWYRGNADAVYQNQEFIRMQRPDLVLVLSGDHIYSMNYNPVLEFHRKHDADLTMVFTKVQHAQAQRFGLGAIENGDPQGGRLLKYSEKPETWPEDSTWASITIYVFKPEALFKVLTEHARLGPKSYEFGKDIIPMMMENYRVFGYKYEGYWGYTRTIDEYWNTSMHLLGEAPLIDPGKWKVRTNLEHNATRDKAPAWIGPQAQIENSLIYSGCRINGRVKNSILFPGADVSEGCVVEDSILMFDSKVQSGTTLHKVITDARVRIGSDCALGEGDATQPNEEYPHLLRTGITLIGHGAKIPARRKIGTNCIVHPELVEEQFRQMEYESGVSIL